jgi:galactonate dehydratase
MRDGFVPILRGPGLGIEVDEEKVRRMAAEGHDWHNPVWRNADGSVTEW